MRAETVLWEAEAQGKAVKMKMRRRFFKRFFAPAEHQPDELPNELGSLVFGGRKSWYAPAAPKR